LNSGVPALGALAKAVAKKVEKPGFLIGLDGRRLQARKANAALNTLLQSAGAVQMKRGLVILFDTLAAKGWEFGREYAVMALVQSSSRTTKTLAKSPAFTSTLRPLTKASIASLQRSRGGSWPIRCS
jgi:hypothetical protein